MATDSDSVVPNSDEAIMTLLEAALSRPKAERESYLRQACGANAELFRQALSYVQSEEQMNGFLSDPIFHLVEPAEQHLRPGDFLVDRFRILREVGEGGMALVYEAYDEKLNRRVAVKWPKLNFRLRLPPEVRLASQIAHPNVCKMFDIHTVSHAGEDVDFLTMEFLEGETLSDRLARAPIPAKQAENIAIQLCSGLAEAHRNQVVHGDLKSNNVILSIDISGSTRAVITDFGLARILDVRSDQPVGSARVGTPDYMAPELWKGGEATKASDIYALGVVLCELISGRKPFGPSVPIEKRGTERPPHVNPKWDHILAKCLHAHPSARFASADEIIARMRVQLRRRVVIGALISGTAVTATWAWISRTGRLPPATTAIAVIPFLNSGPNAETEYLSNGISESLINALAGVPGLKVIARASSARFKGKDVDIWAAARALRVRALVIGTVLDVNGQIRISVELVNASDGTHLWGAQYNTAVAGLRGVEAAILREIVARVGPRLSQTEWSKLDRGAKIKADAYERLLLGRYQMQLYTPASRQQAIAYYQQALAIDPGSALAHAELARAYRLISGSAVVDPAEFLPRAEAASQRALAIDGDLAEAHAALADVKKDRWDWVAAEVEYRRAIELNPNLATAHQGYAIYLSVLKKFDVAVSEIQRAVDLDPVGLPTSIHLAAVYYNARRYNEALKTLLRAAELDPSAPSPWSWMGMVRAASGDFTAAILAYQKSMALGDNTSATQCYYAYSLACAGDRLQPLQIVSRIQRLNSYVPRSALAILFLGLDQRERSLQLLREAYRARDPFLQYLSVETHYDRLRGDAEFNELRRKIGLQ